MRNIVLGATALAALVSPLAATSASAQPYGYGWRAGDGRVAHEVRECRRELRHADNRWEYERERRECRREIAEARRDQRRDRRYDRYRDHYGYGYGNGNGYYGGYNGGYDYRYGYRGW